MHSTLIYQKGDTQVERPRSINRYFDSRLKETHVAVVGDW